MEKWLKPIAVFCICLVINLTIVHAFSISHNRQTDVVIQQQKATISWRTDENSSGSVNYGINRFNLSNTQMSIGSKTAHDVLLENLQPNKLYYYEITATNNANDSIKANNFGNLYSFMTAGQESSNPDDVTPPQISADIPEYYNKKKLAIRGNAHEPGITVKAYVNPSATQVGGPGAKAITVSKEDGSFYMTNVYIGEKAEIVLYAEDKAGNSAKKEYNITVDEQDPVVTLDAAETSTSNDYPVKGMTNEPVTVKIQKGDDAENITSLPLAKGNFSFSVSITGDTFIKLTFVDRAGNEIEFEKDVRLITEPPKIFWHNLDALTPTYVQEVTVRGNVTPGATVVVFVNGETSPNSAWSTSLLDFLKRIGRMAEGKQYNTVAGEDGLFEIPVQLSQDLNINRSIYAPTSPTGTVESQTEVGGQQVGATASVENKIKIVVIDDAGRNATAEGTVTLSTCGGGGDWDIDQGTVSPSVVTTALLNRGLASIGSTLKFRYRGLADASTKPGENKYIIKEAPRLTVYTLNKEERDKYAIDPMKLVKNIRMVHSSDKKSMTYVIDFNQFNIPPDFWVNKTKEKKPKKLLLKIPIMVEIRYEYEFMGKKYTKTQRQCFDATTMIDLQVPPSVIPKELLNNSISLLNSTINAIDKILKPLQEITLYVFIACLVSWVWLFLKKVQEASVCAKEGEGSTECATAKKERESFENKMQWVCDRVFCPSAPSVEKYAKSFASDKKSTSACKGLTKSAIPQLQKDDGGCGEEYNKKWGTACVLMDELERSKCLAGDEKSCGGTAEKAFYAVSDFCSASSQKKDEYVIKHTDPKTKKSAWYRYSKGTWEEGSFDPNKVPKKDAAGNQVTKDGKPVYETKGEVFISKRTLTQEEAEKLGLSPKLNRDVVADPTAGVIRALQCVCLPAITGYLALVRNVMTAIKQCFESILLTGEGKSGVCRAVLTVYICDLIYNAIRCFANMASSGTGSEKGRKSSGTDDFLSNIRKAGGDIHKSIVNRYGKSQLFKTMFTEKKLVHAACLWAFTGDFDLDLKGMLTGAGAVPLKSEGFIYPATRRFITSNPLNKGYGTYVYHLGVGVIAGSKLSYSLELVCSATNTCNPDEGFPGGKCDCFKTGEKSYSLTNQMGGGTAEAGKFIGGGKEGDIYVRLDDHPIRYDKARLTINYVDNENNKKTDKIVVPITQIGGKPPGECSFDLDLSEFRCGFDIGERGYASFTSKPEPKQKYFMIGDTLSVDFKVEKKSPKYNPTATDAALRDPKLQIPFYLIYRLRDQNGKLVDLGGRATTKQKVLVLDKTYTPDDFLLPGIKFKAADLLPASAVTIKCSSKSAVKGTTVISGVKYTCPSKSGFAAEGSAVKFEILSNAVTDTKTKKQSVKYACYLGKYDKDGNVDEKSYKIIEKEKEKTSTDGKFECGGVTITAPLTNAKKGMTFQMTVKSEVTAQKVEKECRDFTTTTPAKWKLELELRYCDPTTEATYLTPDNCKPSSQIVVFNGQAQQYVGATAVEMNLVCAEAKKSANCTKFDQLLTGEGCSCGGVTCGKSDVVGLNYCRKKGLTKPKCITYVPCDNAKQDKKETSLVELGTGNPDYMCDCDGGRSQSKTDMECKSGMACVDEGTKVESKYVCKETK